MLQINASLFIQIFNFLFLLFLLNILLYKPIRQILNQRRQETSSLERAIQDYQNRVGDHRRTIEESAVVVRKEGYEGKERLKDAALEEEKGIIEEANARSEEKIGEAKRQIEDKMIEVRRVLEGELGAFTTELAQKVLGRGI